MTSRLNSGFTLIEVAAGLAILLIISSVVNSFSLFQKTSGLRQEKRQVLATLIQLNVTEMHGRRITSYPAIGNCTVRFYDAKGTFLRESTAGSATATCTDQFPAAAGEIKVTMTFRTPTTTANFTPSQFLKLPHFTPSNIVEVGFSAAYRPTQGSPSPPLTLVILKQA